MLIIAEALVFLRQLGDFRIPAVMERRRKGLLDKLLELQGDTFRGDGAPLHNKPEDNTVTIDEPAKEKMKSPEPAVVIRKEESKDTPPVTSPTRDSPTKRLSRGDSKISALVGNYEHITISAKKEEEAETPKRFVQLKKVAKPTDFPDPDKGKVKEEEPQEDEKPAAPKEVDKVTEQSSLAPQPSPQLRRKEKENGTLKPGRPSSTVSEESVNVEAAEEEEEGEGEGEDVGEKESSKKKGKFKGFKKIGKLGDKLKKKRRDKSPSRPAEDEEEKSGGSEAEEVDKEEPSSPPELEEGVKIAGMLERKVASRFKTKWVKVDVKLKDNTLHIGDKEKVELVGYMVAASDVGFDLVNHSSQKQIHFKLERDEDDKDKWVETLSAAIQECTPEQEGEGKAHTCSACVRYGCSTPETGWATLLEFELIS